MPKNVLFTSWYTGLGGGETDLLSIASCLDPDEWTPHLLLPADGTLAQHWRTHGWPVHIIPYRGASTFFIPIIWKHFPVVGQMQQLLIEHSIDVVSSEYHTLPLIYPAAQAANIPTMWTVHGWWFKPKPWQRGFFRSIPVIARSESIRTGFLGDPPFMPTSKIPVVYSGVDTSRFQPNTDAYIRERFSIGIPQDAPIVAMVARFQSVKGHHTFQAMARQVALQQPEAHFVVAGEDTFGVTKDELYRQAMIEAIQHDTLLRQRFHYIGFRDDIENVLAAADVVVCASDFESYGKVNLEAMACATPVVSTNRGGPSETILDGVTGYLVPPSDPQALSLPVISLLRDNEARHQLGLAAREHISTNFSAKTTANQYDTIFRELLTHP